MLLFFFKDQFHGPVPGAWTMFPKLSSPKKVPTKCRFRIQKELAIDPYTGLCRMALGALPILFTALARTLGTKPPAHPRKNEGIESGTLFPYQPYNYTFQGNKILPLNSIFDFNFRFNR